MSRTECAAQQGARKLGQLNRTAAQMATLLETHTELGEALRQGMKLWLEEKEKMRDAYHQDDLLWGKGITDMVAQVVADTEWDQTEGRTVNTKGVGPEGSIHVDQAQAGGPEKAEERQRLQLRRQLKSLPMPEQKSNPTPKPKAAPAPGLVPVPTPITSLALRGGMSLAPTPLRQWETVTPPN